MKKTDYDEIVRDLADPEKSAEAIVKLSEKLTETEKEFSDIEKSRNTLVETNQKLALRVTGVTPTAETEEEKDPWDEFVGQLRENMKGDE